MFSFLKKSKRAKAVDKVWKSPNACWQGMLKLIKESQAASRPTVVFFFFEEDKNKFVDFARESGMETAVTLVPFESGNRSKIAIVDVSNARLSDPAPSDILVLFRGHYPLIEPEELILEKIGEAGLPAIFCSSLDDGIFEQFGSGNLKSLVESLGLKDDEYIEHAMVSSALLNARKKLQSKVTIETKAKSEREWFHRNLTQL
jgi:hypothetical protein